jgi:hypothetical protein
MDQEAIPSLSDHTGMDADRQHERFRNLVRELVQQRRMAFPAAITSDWVISCYDSLAAFRQRFPNAHEAEKWIEEREDEDQACNETVNSELERILEDGLSYQDVESLRYEFPPCEQTDGSFGREP